MKYLNGLIREFWQLAVPVSVIMAAVTFFKGDLPRATFALVWAVLATLQSREMK